MSIAKQLGERYSGASRHAQADDRDTRTICAAYDTRGCRRRVVDLRGGGKLS
jgi:hypothetical protein